ncbi:hypothetical protein ACFW04_014244 [Cataglyphis niger]
MDKTVKSKKDAFFRELTTEPANPSGKSKRLIILHIGSAVVFVFGELLCFESKRHTGDYHDEMNDDIFHEYKEKEISETMVKAELLQIVSLQKSEFDKYVVDEMTNQYNKTILKLFAYHYIKLLLEQGIDRVTAERWNNFIRHVNDEKKKMWEIMLTIAWTGYLH